MYLKYLEDDNLKSNFISQIVLISKIAKLDIGNFEDDSSSDSYNIFGFLYSKEKYKNIIMKFIDEMSYNSKTIKDDLKKTVINTKMYLEEFEDNNSTMVKSMTNDTLNNLIKMTNVKIPSDLREYMLSMEHKESYILTSITDETLDKIWPKYSLNCSNSKVKNICYFELLNYFSSISSDLEEDTINKLKDVYFIYVKRKLDISDNVSKKINNFINITESVYKSLNDLINIG